MLRLREGQTLCMRVKRQDRVYKLARACQLGISRQIALSLQNRAHPGRAMPANALYKPFQLADSNEK